MAWTRTIARLVGISFVLGFSTPNNVKSKCIVAFSPMPVAQRMWIQVRNLADVLNEPCPLAALHSLFFTTSQIRKLYSIMTKTKGWHPFLDICMQSTRLNPRVRRRFVASAIPQPDAHSAMRTPSIHRPQNTCPLERAPPCHPSTFPTTTFGDFGARKRRAQHS